MDDERGRSTDEGKGPTDEGKGPTDGGTASTDDGRRYVDDDRGVPGWMRSLAEYGYLVAFVLFLLTVLSMRDDPFGRGPVPRTFGGLTAGVLLYQTWFLVARTDAATDVGVLIPYGNGIDRLESEGWAYPLAFLTGLFVVVLVTGMVVP